jgi:putative ABC transport system permease protein
MKFVNIALRNLSRQKRRTLLLGSAIAFGVFIVTLVNALSAGTIRILQDNMADLVGGHVFVSLEYKDGDKTISVIDDETKLLAAAKALGVADDRISRTMVLRGSTVIFNGKETLQQVYGLSVDKDTHLSAKLGLSVDDVAKIKAKKNSLVIAKKTAEKLKVSVGDTVLVKCRTITGQQNVGEFEIVAVTNDTSEFSGIIAFGRRDFLVELANLANPSSYLQMTIKLDNLDLAPAFAEALKAEVKKAYPLKKQDNGMNFSMTSSVFKIGDSADFTGTQAEVTTINDMMSTVTQAASVLRYISLGVLVLLLLITMIGIANTFRMIMYERTKEIGTMRALGMHRGEVRSIMLWEAVFLSLSGVILGVAVAFLGMVVLSLPSFGTESFVAIILQNGHLFFQLDVPSLVAATILVVVFTWLAALGPARKAAKLEPAEALRTNY